MIKTLFKLITKLTKREQRMTSCEKLETMMHEDPVFKSSQATEGQGLGISNSLIHLLCNREVTHTFEYDCLICHISPIV